VVVVEDDVVDGNVMEGISLSLLSNQANNHENHDDDDDGHGSCVLFCTVILIILIMTPRVNGRDFLFLFLLLPHAGLVSCFCCCYLLMLLLLMLPYMHHLCKV
jgi:hypothetical protein